MKLLFEKSSSIAHKRFLPAAESKPKSTLPEKLLRKSLEIPEVAESEIMRHYTELSKRNIGVDNAFYPLGSCTMKYNPRINEQTSRLDGFTATHPLFEKRCVQGNIELMVNLSEAISAITGECR